MPEGPSLLILSEDLQKFENRRVKNASGTADILFARLLNKTIRQIKSHGKHLLIIFDDFFIRIHLLMFGKCLINERRETAPKLRLRFSGDDELNFYTCSVRLIEGNPSEVYDSAADVLSEKWDHALALKKLRSKRDENVCDVLLDQDIFAGVGNIIKNEVLFRTRIHPACSIRDLPSAKRSHLVREAVNYSFDFLNWKRQNILKRNWKIYKKKTCPRCGQPVFRNNTGKTKRLTCWCENCQRKYRA
jgi:endonuclease VIII